MGCCAGAGGFCVCDGGHGDWWWWNVRWATAARVDASGDGSHAVAGCGGGQFSGSVSVSWSVLGGIVFGSGDSEAGGMCGGGVISG